MSEIDQLRFSRLEDLKDMGLGVNIHRNLAPLVCVQIDLPKVALDEQVPEKCEDCGKQMDMMLHAADWLIGRSMVVVRFNNPRFNICETCQIAQPHNGSQRDIMDGALRFVADRVNTSRLGGSIPSVELLETILR